MTSHDVVDVLRRATGERRIGHAGTLDPLATGVLPLVLGAATRLVRFLPGDPKVYRVTLRLGLETTTGDIEGEPLSPPVRPSLDAPTFDRALRSLEGSQEQLPPMFSARKVGGQPLYRAARKGQVVARKPAAIVVHGLSRIGPLGQPGQPNPLGQDDEIDPDAIELEVRCSPGTYVRSLVVDLGHRLGTGATVTRLRRLGSGPFLAEAALPLDQLRLDPTRIERALVPLDELPLALPAVAIDARDTVSFRAGRMVSCVHHGPAGLAAVRSNEGRLLGVGRIELCEGRSGMPDGPAARLLPTVVLAAPTPEA